MLAGPPAAGGTRVRYVSFYLPQYHPVPENDGWWGPGFTDWTNVVQGRPRMRGHYQPHIPADLGFYDLRAPEVRERQAELARTHEIDAFCYYHYWFGGRRILERPFAELLDAREPDHPFMLCWANENWTRNWNGGQREILLEQVYSDEDDLEHIRWLLAAFADSRYLRIDGKPAFAIYRPTHMPDMRRTAETWRNEARRLGMGELYLCGVHNFAVDRIDPVALGLDAAIQFAPDWIRMGPRVGMSKPRRAARKYLRPDSPYRKNNVRRYDEMVRATLAGEDPPYLRFPGVSPGFDSYARRRNGGAIIVLGSTPDLYAEWLEGVLERFEPPSPQENLVFVNAWNEWAEGNHLEPDLRWGRGYLEAHARVARAHDPSRLLAHTAADPGEFVGADAGLLAP